MFLIPPPPPATSVNYVLADVRLLLGLREVVIREYPVLFAIERDQTEVRILDYWSVVPRPEALVLPPDAELDLLRLLIEIEYLVEVQLDGLVLDVLGLVARVVNLLLVLVEDVQKNLRARSWSLVVEAAADEHSDLPVSLLQKLRAHLLRKCKRVPHLEPVVARDDGCVPPDQLVSAPS